MQKKAVILLYFCVLIIFLATCSAGYEIIDIYNPRTITAAVPTSETEPCSPIPTYTPTPMSFPCILTFVDFELPVISYLPQSPLPLHESYAWVVPPIFEYVRLFEYGYAVAKCCCRFGIVNMYGQIVVPIIFDDMGRGFSSNIDMSSGFIEARFDGRWGVVDTAGRVIVPFEYDAIFVMPEYSVAIVSVGERIMTRYQGLIDLTTGEVLVPIGEVNGMWRGSYGLVPAARHTGNWANRLYGFICVHTGETVIPFMYEGVSNFRRGGAPVRHNGMWGAIDRYNQVIELFIHAQSHNVVIGGYSTVTANIHPPDRITATAVASDTQRSSLRTYVITDTYENRELGIVSYYFDTGTVDRFRGNFAIITVGNAWGDDWNFGLIDKYGTEILPPIHARLHHFTDDLLQIDGGRFNRQGRLVNIHTMEQVLPWFDSIGILNYGYALINTEGTWIPYYEWMDKIVYGYWGVINYYGVIIIPPVLPFRDIYPAGQGLYTVQQPCGKWGGIRLETEFRVH